MAHKEEKLLDLFAFESSVKEVRLASAGQIAARAGVTPGGGAMRRARECFQDVQGRPSKRIIVSL